MDPVRIEPPATPRPRGVDGAKPSQHLKALEPLLGHTWEARGDRPGGDVVPTRTTFEWVPLADAVYVRVVATREGGGPRHLLDAYVYHHTGAKVLRCLALSADGGVYEGDVTTPGGAVQLDLKGYEGDRVIPYLVRLDFPKDGSVRQRVWSGEGTDRTLRLDAHHAKLEPKKD